MTPKYLNIWTSREEVFNEFNKEDDPTINILLASYDSEGYEGSAFVLFEQGGKLFTVTGSHCSCHGLENQWEPDITDIPTLYHFLNEGATFNNFSEEMSKILKELDFEVKN